jgi:hypothetical protein
LFSTVDEANKEWRPSASPSQTPDRAESADARHWSVGGSYAASFGRTLSTNRKNRVLQARDLNLRLSLNGRQGRVSGMILPLASIFGTKMHALDCHVTDINDFTGTPLRGSKQACI